MPYIFLFALLLFLVGLWLLRQGARAQQASGLPTSEVIYSDTNTWQRVERPLLSRRYGLVGKPDYVVVVEEGRRRSTIPVEVKSGKSPAQPHLGHLRQLGVYCLLVEETYGQTPTHGLLQYADATLRIPFTAELRRDVLAITAEIQQAHSARNVARNHNEPARCRSCGYREACGKAALS